MEKEITHIRGKMLLLENILHGSTNNFFDVKILEPLNLLEMQKNLDLNILEPLNFCCSNTI